MFSAKYNSYSKEYIVYKNNKECAIMTDNNLILKSILSIDEIHEICEMLDFFN